MGLNGADKKATLTKSPYLKITSSDIGVVEVHQKNAIVIGKKPGQVEIRISFSEATSVAQAFVKERKSDSAENVGEKLKL
jgi:fibronectin type 3 domain-containing protein